MSQTDGNHQLDDDHDDDGSSGLDQLITDLATGLMGIGVNDASAATDDALLELRSFFEVTRVFLRRHDLEPTGDHPGR